MHKRLSYRKVHTNDFFFIFRVLMPRLLYLNHHDLISPTVKQQVRKGHGHHARRHHNSQHRPTIPTNLGSTTEKVEEDPTLTASSKPSVQVEGPTVSDLTASTCPVSVASQSHLSRPHFSQRAKKEIKKASSSAHRRGGI